MKNLFPALFLVSRLFPDTSSHSFFDHSRHLVFDVGVRCKQANHANIFWWCERLRTRLKMTLKGKFCWQSSCKDIACDCAAIFEKRHICRGKHNSLQYSVVLPQ